MREAGGRRARGGSPKLITGAPEAWKLGGRSKPVAINSAKNHAQETSSPENQKFSGKCQTFSYTKHDQNWNSLLISTVTSAESKHDTYLCSIFMFVYVPLHMFLKMPTSLLQSVMIFFLSFRNLTDQFVGI